jgi:hypothetical protein
MNWQELAKKTNNLFGDTYWNYAHGTRRNGNLEVMEAIYDNRLRLWERYQLHKMWRSRDADIFRSWGYGPRPEGEVDHAECYTTRYGGVVLICSNYNAKPPELLFMYHCPDLYIPGAKSYLVEFEYKSEASAILRALSPLMALMARYHKYK